MTSERGPVAPPGRAPGRAYVWTWLPGSPDPVPAGVLEGLPGVGTDRILTFAYARSYRERPGAPALYLPELPIRPGRLEPPAGMTVAGVIRDAGPDAWGQRSAVPGRRRAWSMTVGT